jgi:hypothetical protein
MEPPLLAPGDPWSMSKAAVLIGHGEGIDALRRLLQRDPTLVRRRDQEMEQRTALHHACIWGYLEVRPSFHECITSSYLSYAIHHTLQSSAEAEKLPRCVQTVAVSPKRSVVVDVGGNLTVGACGMKRVHSFFTTLAQPRRILPHHFHNTILAVF